MFFAKFGYLIDEFLLASSHICRELNIIMLCKPGAKALDFVQSNAFGATELTGRRGVEADLLTIAFGDKGCAKIHAPWQGNGLGALHVRTTVAFHLPQPAIHAACHDPIFAMRLFNCDFLGKDPPEDLIFLFDWIWASHLPVSVPA